MVLHFAGIGIRQSTPQTRSGLADSNGRIPLTFNWHLQYKPHVELPSPAALVMDRKKHLMKGHSAQCISITSLTEEVLGQFANKIASRNIRVDKDLPRLTADVFPRFIHSAVCQLIENAIDAMPGGGELNITLIDGDRCWELEVADSTTDNQSTELRPSKNLTGLPKIIPLDHRSKLELARRAAIVHGGKVETWDCPQGGTANVLVIPRRQETRKAA